MQFKKKKKYFFSYILLKDISTHGLGSSFFLWVLPEQLFCGSTHQESQKTSDSKPPNPHKSLKKCDQAHLWPALLSSEREGQERSLKHPRQDAASSTCLPV